MNIFFSPVIHNRNPGTEGTELTEDQIKTLKEFENKLLENMEDLDPEFSKLIDDHQNTFMLSLFIIK